MNSKPSYLLFVIICLGIIFRLFMKFTADRTKSNFRVSEADLPKTPLDPARIEKRPKTSKPATPLQLDGFRFDGAAHEILRISANANEAEINKAYRDLMKRFHPDVVGRPGTQAWADAQPLAEAINRARNELLVRLSQSQKKS